MAAREGGSEDVKGVCQQCWDSRECVRFKTFVHPALCVQVGAYFFPISKSLSVMFSIAGKAAVLMPTAFEFVDAAAAREA